MRANDLVVALDELIEQKLPAFIIGSPGIGKSAIMQQIAERHHMKLYNIRALLYDPTDFQGIPYVDGGVLKRAIPTIFPQNGDEKAIVFLDELTSAPPMVQAVLYQLIFDRKIGEYELPEGCVVMAAGNKLTDKAVVNRMSTALISRFINLTLECNIDDWLVWAGENDIAPEVMAFLKFRPNFLHAFDPNKNEPFPCPRTWEFVSNIVKRNIINKNVEMSLIQGAIGEGVTREFVGFLRVLQNLPNINEIFIDPKNAMVPTDPSALYALINILAKKVDKESIENLVSYSARLPKEFSAALISLCIKNKPEIQNTTAFIHWAASRIV